MSVTYRRLNSHHLKECINLQKEIFGFNDIDLISPAVLQLYSRDIHPLGIMVGCFINENNTEKLIGFSLGMADLPNNSLYFTLLGILPKYQKSVYGTGLILKLRELAIENKIRTMYGFYDPLDTGLAHLYFGYGITVEKYVTDAFQLEQNNSNKSIPSDKVLFSWAMLSKRVCTRISNPGNKLKLDEIIKKYSNTNNKILFEIPSNFKELQKNDINAALKCRIKTGSFFKEKINNQNYRIVDYFTGKINNIRRSFYLLQK